MFAIHSVDEFLTTFQVGDVFWHITSSFGQGPVAVEQGQIRKFTVSDQGDMVVHYLCNNQVTHYFVSDLTNDHHGVFRSSTEAMLALIDRQDQYQNDPANKARLEHQNATVFMSWLLTDYEIDDRQDDLGDDDDEFDDDDFEDEEDDEDYDDDDDLDDDDFEDEDDDDEDEYDPDPTNM